MLAPCSMRCKAFTQASSKRNLRVAGHYRNRRTLRTQAALEPFYSPGGGDPSTTLGPIKVAQIPGKGRGVVATQPLAKGDLVMVSEPLAVIWGEPWSAEQPDSEQLHAYMTELKQYNARDLQLMATMFNGTAESLEAPQEGVLQEVSSGEAAAAAAGATLPFPQTGYPEDLLWGLIAYNCFGDGFQDLPLALARGEEPKPQLGLWPEFSLINHSCLPNSVNYLMGDRMVVRAVSPVAAGEEVLINYLGRSNLRPVQQRYAELEDCYGFFCQCTRCQAEFDAPEEVSQLLDTILNKVGTEVGPALEKALQKMDAAAIAAVRDELLQLTESLEGLLQQQKLAPGQQLSWLRASAYDALNLANVCYEQLAAIQETQQQQEGGAPVPQEQLQGQEVNLGRMVAVVADVAGGSDLHIFIASKRLTLVQRLHGEQSEQAAQAAGDVQSAVQLRYGSTSNGCQTMLTKAATDALQKVIV